MSKYRADEEIIGQAEISDISAYPFIFGSRSKSGITITMHSSITELGRHSSYLIYKTGLAKSIRIKRIERDLQSYLFTFKEILKVDSVIESKTEWRPDLNAQTLYIESENVISNKKKKQEKIKIQCTKKLEDFEAYVSIFTSWSQTLMNEVLTPNQSQSQLSRIPTITYNATKINEMEYVVQRLTFSYPFSQYLSIDSSYTYRTIIKFNPIARFYFVLIKDPCIDKENLIVLIKLLLRLHRDAEIDIVTSGSYSFMLVQKQISDATRKKVFLFLPHNISEFLQRTHRQDCAFFLEGKSIRMEPLVGAAYTESLIFDRMN